MKLTQWRLTHTKTLTECAALFGLASARTYQRYETGETRADADLVEVITARTMGDVKAADMYNTRLEWLKANRPERFSTEAAE